MYHSIGRFADDAVRIGTSPERFQAHMGYLKRRNLRGVSVRELRQAESLGNLRGLVGITFDDGYADFLQMAVPVLEQLGFSATVFVVGGRLGEENDWAWDRGLKPRIKLLGAEDVREVSARGMEVGAHGLSHIPLAGLEPESLEEEVNLSRQVIGEALGERVEGFSYPYGSLDDAALEAVRRAGYAYACATPPRIEWQPYALPRVPVAENDNLPRFVTKLNFYREYRTAKDFYSRQFGASVLPEA
jgi:peptidoglycan/xylan/chitin deacetylase (PgdA/CDA1 family)